MGKNILLISVLVFSLTAGTSLTQASPERESVDIASWMDTFETPFHAEDVKPCREIVPPEPGKTPYLYVRVLPALDAIDGGPNIDHADQGTGTYKEAFSPGVGVNFEFWTRFESCIYMTVQVGATRFEGGHTLDTMDPGLNYRLRDMTIFYATIGGAFTGPLAFLTRTTGKVDDLQGLLGIVHFNLGIGYQAALKAEWGEVSSSYPYVTGDTFDFWKSAARFVGQFAIGLSYRAGPFSLLVDIGVRTFGRPRPDTEPRWWSGGATMITYPIRAGASYRF